MDEGEVVERSGSRSDGSGHVHCRGDMSGDSRGSVRGRDNFSIGKEKAMITVKAGKKKIQIKVNVTK